LTSFIGKFPDVVFPFVKVVFDQATAGGGLSRVAELSFPQIYFSGFARWGALISKRLREIYFAGNLVV
jgi:hypothetical protein